MRSRVAVFHLGFWSVSGKAWLPVRLPGQPGYLSNLSDDDDEGWTKRPAAVVRLTQLKRPGQKSEKGKASYN